jgi:hypothetical protein
VPRFQYSTLRYCDYCGRVRFTIEAGHTLLLDRPAMRERESVFSVKEIMPSEPTAIDCINSLLEVIHAHGRYSEAVRYPYAVRMSPMPMAAGFSLTSGRRTSTR